MIFKVFDYGQKHVFKVQQNSHELVSSCVMIPKMTGLA